MMIHEQIEKARRRLQAQKDANMRKVVLQEVLPLMSAMQRQFDIAIESADKNFSDLFKTIGIGMDHADFMHYTRTVVGGMSVLIDTLAVEAGLFQLDEKEGTLSPTEGAKEELLDSVAQVSEMLKTWFEQADIIDEMFEDEEDTLEDDNEETEVDLPEKAEEGEPHE